MATVNNPADTATQYPSATFTELEPADGKIAGKTIFEDGVIADYPQVKYFRWRLVTVNDIDDLFAYLNAAQNLHGTHWRHVCIVRGIPNDGALHLIRRKLEAVSPQEREPDRFQTGFHDEPQAIFALDFDSVKLDEGHDWLVNPQAAIHSVICRLPEPWSKVSYVAFFTGSHGLLCENKKWTGKYDTTTVRFRIFVMLDKSIEYEDAKAWSICLRDETGIKIDPSLSDSPVRIIYVERPRWSKHAGQDVLDAAGVPTCWLHRGEIDVIVASRGTSHGTRILWQ